MKKRRQKKNTKSCKSEGATPLNLLSDDQFDLCTLSAYGASSEEASQAITTSRAAHCRLISKCAFGTDKPSTVAHLEWLIFSCVKHSSDPVKELSDVLNKPYWKKRINEDAAGFIRRLHEFMESKKTEHFDVIDGALVTGWTHQPLTRFPPFCLATDRLLGILFNRSEAVIRQRIARLKLYRPTRPRISGREVIKDGKGFILIEERRKPLATSGDDFIQFVKRNFFSGDKVRPNRDRKS